MSLVKPIVIYLIYLFVLISILLFGLKELITILIVPMTLIFGVVVWHYQEDVKKRRDRSESLFSSYVKYERSVQKVFSHVQAIRNEGFHGTIELEGFQSSISQIRAELVLNRSLYDDLYAEIVLCNELVYKDDEIYEEAAKLRNSCSPIEYFIYETQKLMNNKIIDGELPMLNFIGKEFQEYISTIEHLDFGFGNPKKVIFTGPRREINKFRKYFLKGKI